MKIFVSHSHAQQEDADRLALALRAAGHEPFLDRDGLNPGDEYNAGLRKALQDSDLVLFMVTPQSVRPGSFALSEVEFARQRWRNPVGHVLPVLWEPTPTEQIPPYLATTTLRMPRGNKVAETVAWVDALGAERQASASRPPRRRLIVAGLLAALLLAGVGWVIYATRPAPVPCLLRLSVLAAPEPVSTADLPSLRKSFIVSDGVALLDLVGLPPAPPQWTLQMVLNDGRLGGTFEVRGCPALAKELDDGRGSRIRIEPRR